MSAKSIAPSNDRNPPEIFCRSFIMRGALRVMKEGAFGCHCVAPS
jgi:hypothetical protein